MALEDLGKTRPRALVHRTAAVRGTERRAFVGDALEDARVYARAVVRREIRVGSEGPL